MRRRLRRPVEEDPLSVHSVSNMKSWIKDCMDNHGTCSIPNESFTPTRLLNVRDRVILQQMNNTGPVQYVALSHCWGPPNLEKAMLKTTRETIAASTEIPMAMYDHLVLGSSRCRSFNLTRPRPAGCLKLSKMLSSSPELSGTSIFGSTLCASSKTVQRTGTWASPSPLRRSGSLLETPGIKLENHTARGRHETVSAHP